VSDHVRELSAYYIWAINPKKSVNPSLVIGALVYFWHARWRESGLDGLADKPRTGHPKAGGDEYRQKLEQVIETDPKALGYGFNVWTNERPLIKAFPSS
jgi:hypothetical protein